MNLCPVLVLTKSVDQRKIVMGVCIIGVSIEIGIQKLGRLLPRSRVSMSRPQVSRVFSFHIPSVFAVVVAGFG